jgi:hypothetical protein
MSARGQASIELLGALPLVLAVAFAAFAAISAHAAAEQAGEAAEAGAIAILQDSDPRAAAEAALTPSVRSRAHVSVAGTHVRVRVRPRLPIPGIADRLAATADAEAGPAAATRPHPVAPPPSVGARPAATRPHPVASLPVRAAGRPPRRAAGGRAGAGSRGGPR